MKLEVRCACGNLYSLDAKMAGRKVRCGECKEIIAVPQGRANGPAVAEPSPFELPTSMLSAEEQAPEEFATMDEHEDESSTVSATLKCPVCGTEATEGDTICLACGAELLEQKPGLFNAILAQIPPRVRLGIGVGLSVIIVLWISTSFYRSSVDDRLVATGREKLALLGPAPAQKAFKEALSWNSTNAGAVEGLVRCGLATGNRDMVNRWVRQLERLSATGQLSSDELSDEALATVFRDAARYCFEEGDIKRARQLVTRSKNIDPELEALKELQGHLLFAEGKTEEAKDIYEAIHAVGSDDGRVYLNLAQIARAGGRRSEARRYVDQAMKRDSGRANIALARINEDEEKWDEALALWTTAASKKPDLHAARLGLARAQMRAGQFVAARGEIDAARRLNPTDIETKVVRAEVLYRLELIDESLAESQKVLDVDRRNAKARFLNGAAQILKGLETKNGLTTANGEKNLKAALETLGDPALYVEAARVLRAAPRKINESLAFLQKALELNPQLLEAHKLVISIHEQSQKSPATLRKALEDALNVAPGDIDMNEKLSALYWSDLREPEALSCLKQACKSAPDDARLLELYARRLMDYGSEDREPPLDSDERVVYLTEALRILEAELRERLKAAVVGLSDDISSVKTQLLQIGDE